MKVERKHIQNREYCYEDFESGQTYICIKSSDNDPVNYEGCILYALPRRDGVIGVWLTQPAKYPQVFYMTDCNQHMKNLRFKEINLILKEQ